MEKLKQPHTHNKPYALCLLPFIQNIHSFIIKQADNTLEKLLKLEKTPF